MRKQTIEFLDALATECYQNAVSKGFWEKFHKQVAKGSNPEEIAFIEELWSSQNLMLATSELGEAIEAQRKGRGEADWDEYRRELVKVDREFDANLFEGLIKDSKGDEIADAIIRLLQQCAGERIPIGKHIVHKMAYNAQRERLHGKKF